MPETGNKPPTHRVVSNIAQGPQSTMGTQWKEPLVLPARRRKAAKKKKRRYLTWILKNMQRLRGDKTQDLEWRVRWSGQRE